MTRRCRSQLFTSSHLSGKLEWKASALGCQVLSAVASTFKARGRQRQLRVSAVLKEMSSSDIP